MIAILLVCFREADTGLAINFFSRYKNYKKVAILNNASLYQSEAINFSGWQIVNGSNKNNEFSGWQEGLESIKEQPLKGVVFANDTIIAHHSLPVITIQSAAIKMSIFLFRDFYPLLVGKIGKFNNGSVNNLNHILIEKWVSTHFFYMNLKLLKRLDFIINNSSITENYVCKGFSSNFFFSKDVSNDLANHIDKWLFRDGWYNSQRLSASNFKFFRSKTIALLTETDLSGICIMKGAKLIDSDLIGIARIVRYILRLYKRK